MSSALASSAELVPGISPQVYSQKDFEAIGKLVYDQVGIILPKGKAMLVYSRLAPLVRNCGAETFGNFVSRIGSDKEERDRAVAALTTNHTFFYRESHHFEHFAETLRKDFIERLMAGGSVRMWSAGCSSGEETWSLLMTLFGQDRGEGKRIASKDIRMLASDIAPKALRKASDARYALRDLEAVPEQIRKPWIEQMGEDAQIAETMRSIVRFRKLNLQGPWPMKRTFDVIFCRNVMIYFDNPTKERLIARFAEALAPGGYLYIGHSERVTGPATSQLRSVGPTIYRKGAA